MAGPVRGTAIDAAELFPFRGSLVKQTRVLADRTTREVHVLVGQCWSLVEYLRADALPTVRPLPVVSSDLRATGSGTAFTHHFGMATPLLEVAGVGSRIREHFRSQPGDCAAILERLVPHRDRRGSSGTGPGDPELGRGVRRRGRYTRSTASMETTASPKKPSGPWSPIGPGSGRTLIAENCGPAWIRKTIDARSPLSPRSEEVNTAATSTSE